MSFGEELRQARELRGISLREVVQATKINARYLEALERNDFAYLPGGLFNRGFVRAYCEHIGVDPEDMVNAYLLEERAQTGIVTRAATDGRLLRGQNGTAPESERRLEDVRKTRVPRVGRRWLLALALVGALLAAGAYLVLRTLGTGDESQGAPSLRTQPTSGLDGALREEEGHG